MQSCRLFRSLEQDTRSDQFIFIVHFKAFVCPETVSFQKLLVSMFFSRTILQFFLLPCKYCFSYNILSSLNQVHVHYQISNWHSVFILLECQYFTLILLIILEDPLHKYSKYIHSLIFFTEWRTVWQVWLFSGCLWCHWRFLLSSIWRYNHSLI